MVHEISSFQLRLERNFTKTSKQASLDHRKRKWPTSLITFIFARCLHNWKLGLDYVEMWNYQRMMRSKEREKTVLSYKMANAGLQQDKEEIKTTATRGVANL